MMVVLTLVMTSCSSMKESLVFGTGAGAATGAITGAAMTPPKYRTKMALQGALVGGLIGGIASFFMQKQVEKRDEKVRRETLFNLEKFNVSRPDQFEFSPAPMDDSLDFYKPSRK